MEGVTEASRATNVNVVVASPPPSPVTIVETTRTRSYVRLQPFAIFRFWQGICEMVLRVLICVLAFVTMITAAVGRSSVDDVQIEGRDFVNKSDLKGAFGYAVIVTIFIMICLATIAVVRVIGIGAVNQLWIAVGIIDIVDSFFWAGNSFVVTVVSGVSAANASKAYDNCLIFQLDLNATCAGYEPVARSGAATAFFSTVMCIALAVLAVYMIFFLIFRWNEKLLGITPVTGDKYAKMDEPQ